MNEEEKKAIERLEEQLNFWKKQNIKNSDCEIILNLIAKLQKENEEKDKQIEALKEDVREESNQKLEDGEYVRTKNGIIYKSEYNISTNLENIPEKYKKLVDNVEKHSKNIIDLIEERRYSFYTRCTK